MAKATNQGQQSETEVDYGVANLSFQAEENNENLVKEQTTVKATIDPTELSKEKRRIWISLVCFFTSVTLSFSSSITLIDSITSLYPNGNLGNTVLAVAGSSQVVSSAFFASTSIKLWGCLKMLRIGLVINLVFIISFFYPGWITLTIGAVFFGFAASLLFTSGFMYANSAGYWLAQLTNNMDNIDGILVRVSGIMNASLGSGFVWGNIALFFVLGPPPDINLNSSQALCGAAYCNQELNLTTLEPPPKDRYYTLIGILTAMSVVACGAVYFLEDFSEKLGYVKCTKKEIWTVFLNTWRLFKNPNGFLLVPMTLAIAMEEAFLVGDVTKALISCSLGISMVGLVMMAFGVTQLVVSIAHWPIVQKFGRPFGIGAAIIVLMVAIGTMLFWKTNPHQLYVYFILVCLWATADAVLISVTFATYGIFFEENLEGAFAAASFFLSSGISFCFVCSPFFCMDVKLYFIGAMFCVSFVLYLILEKCACSRQQPAEIKYET